MTVAVMLDYHFRSLQKEIRIEQQEIIKNQKKSMLLFISSKKSFRKQTFPFGGFKKTESDKPASSIFGKKEEDGDAAKQTLSFPVFGKKEDSNSDAKPAISFPSFGKKEDDGPKAALSFPSFSSARYKSNLLLATLPIYSSKSIFGNPATSGTLAFNPPPASNATNKDDEDGEYVPPKAEVVENNEPGATYSTKYYLFVFV